MYVLLFADVGVGVRDREDEAAATIIEAFSGSSVRGENIGTGLYEYCSSEHPCWDADRGRPA